MMAEAHGNRTRPGRSSRPTTVLKTAGSTSQPDASAGRLSTKGESEQLELREECQYMYPGALASRRPQ